MRSPFFLLFFLSLLFLLLISFSICVSIYILSFYRVSILIFYYLFYWGLPRVNADPLLSAASMLSIPPLSLSSCCVDADADAEPADADARACCSARALRSSFSKGSFERERERERRGVAPSPSGALPVFLASAASMAAFYIHVIKNKYIIRRKRKSRSK